MTDEEVIKIRYDVLYELHWRIVTKFLSIEEVTEILEESMNFLRGEQSVADVQNIINKPGFPPDRSTKHMDG